MPFGEVIIEIGGELAILLVQLQKNRFGQQVGEGVFERHILMFAQFFKHGAYIKQIIIGVVCKHLFAVGAAFLYRAFDQNMQMSHRVLRINQHIALAEIGDIQSTAQLMLLLSRQSIKRW
ncbi:Uncharacterised protein [Vibrio cholerae]|nr:Uncharacterised protein [Vibrio cholerae]